MADSKSILSSVKKNLGLPEDYESFDHDIVMHINSAFFTLHQLGVGPREGYMIEDKEMKWEEFMGSNPSLSAVKLYVYSRVRLGFDTPTTSFAIDALKETIKEYEWRLNVAEDTTWILVEPGTDPTPGAGLSDIVWNLTDAKEFPPNAPIGAVGVDFTSGKVWKKT